MVYVIAVELSIVTVKNRNNKRWGSFILAGQREERGVRIWQVDYR
jgi:hypothetical protein